MESPLRNEISGYNSFTGCDYTAAFKGKVKPLKLMNAKVESFELFTKLGEILNIDPESLDLYDQ